MQPTTDLQKSGIYCIFNKINGKKYIGSSVNIYRRLMRHLNELRKGIHKNQHLQSSWNQYNEENFDYIILEFINDEAYLQVIEEHYIKALSCCDNHFGFNINETTQKPKCFELLRKRITDKLNGKTFSEEHKNNLSQAHKDYYRTPEKIKEIVILYKENVKCTDIEKITGLSRPTIRKVLKEAGIFGRSKSFKGSTGENHKNSKPKATCLGCGKTLSKRKYTTCNQCRDKIFPKSPMSEETKKKLSEAKTGKHWNELANRFV